jgi:hypothetical protein
VVSSFLKTGVILANFHLAGTTPRERERHIEKITK